MDANGDVEEQRENKVNKKKLKKALCCYSIFKTFDSVCDSSAAHALAVNVRGSDQIS